MRTLVELISRQNEKAKYIKMEKVLRTELLITFPVSPPHQNLNLSFQCVLLQLKNFDFLWLKYFLIYI